MNTIEDNPLRDLNNARNLPKDTPETDAKASPHIGFYSCATVPADFARRLERERDEAIRQRGETNRSSKYACDYYYEEKLKAERERDTALDKVTELKGVIKALRSNLRETSRET